MRSPFLPLCLAGMAARTLTERSDCLVPSIRPQLTDTVENSMPARRLVAPRIEGEVGIFEQVGVIADAFESILALNFTKRELVSAPLTSKETSVPIA